ncbi:MAG: hypothetical protein HYZ83_04790 [Candidatus Omnitrophica bacterium]|nr:hypothetical protein [Candidatus Omnitrophota bacterium]
MIKAGNHFKGWKVSILLVIFLLSCFPLGAEVSRNSASWLNYQAQLLKNKRDFLYQLRNFLLHKMEKIHQSEIELKEKIRRYWKQRAELLAEKKQFRQERQKFEAAIKRRKWDIAIRQATLADQAEELALERVDLKQDRGRFEQEQSRFKHMKQSFHSRKKAKSMILPLRAGNTAEDVQSKLKGLEETLKKQEGKLQQAQAVALRAKNEKIEDTQSQTKWQLKAIDGAKALMAAPAVITVSNSEVKNYPSLFRGRAVAAKN